MLNLITKTSKKLLLFVSISLLLIPTAKAASAEEDLTASQAQVVTDCFAEILAAKTIIFRVSEKIKILDRLIPHLANLDNENLCEHPLAQLASIALGPLRRIALTAYSKEKLGEFREQFDGLRQEIFAKIENLQELEKQIEDSFEHCMEYITCPMIRRAMDPRTKAIYPR